MSDTVRLMIEGVDNVDAMELREALEEQGTGDIEFSEEPYRPLGLSQHGAADLIRLAFDVATVAIPAVSAGVALWLTRRKTKLSDGNVVFVVEGEKIVYRSFGASEVSQSSDPEQISAALRQRLAPPEKSAGAAKGGNKNAGAAKAGKTKKAKAATTAGEPPKGAKAVKPKRQAKRTA